MKITVIDTNKHVFPKLKRVAGYARVSKDGSTNANSIETQISYLNKKISSNPSWVNSGVFADFGFSGTKTERPSFQALMNKCNEGKVDMVITKSISRFCRNTVDLLSTVRHLKELGVEVFFDENNISTFSKEGELVMTLLASQAQEESRSISENVKWAIRSKFKKGIGLPHDLMGYRWNGKEYKIVESEAMVIRKIYDLYLSGFGATEIAKRLNEIGIKGIKGHPMTYSTVTKILRQEKYMGDSLLQKTFIQDHISHKTKTNKGEKDMYYAEGTHPPIISKETHDAVMSEMEKRRNMNCVETNWTLSTSVFTSKIVCCDCGRTFRRKTKTNYGKSKYYEWVCGERIDHKHDGCHSKSIPEWVLYEKTAEVLGKEDFSDEEFKQKIKGIIGGKFHEITFLLTDGTSITKTWERRKRNGNKC